MELREFIDCNRYGGRRPAGSCVHFDKYKSCRRHCSALKQHLAQNPGFVEEVQKRFEAKEEGAPGPCQLNLLMAAKHSGKNVPDPELACTSCNFVARTVRGLKTHRTRAHKIAKRG